MTYPLISSDDPFHRTLQTAVAALDDALMELVIQWETEAPLDEAINKTLRASRVVRMLADVHRDDDPS